MPRNGSQVSRSGGIVGGMSQKLLVHQPLNFHFSCCPYCLAQRQKNVTIITKMVLY
jgi:hypothetical protein